MSGKCIVESQSVSQNKSIEYINPCLKHWFITMEMENDHSLVQDNTG